MLLFLSREKGIDLQLELSCNGSSKAFVHLNSKQDLKELIYGGRYKRAFVPLNRK
jgi:hypothetical protein